MVNTASMAGVTSLGGLGPYVASKHAVVGLTETLFHDLAAAGAGDRIGVTAVCPGYVPTRIGLDDPRAAVPAVAPGAVTADDVATRVLEAIAERRVFVFTHEGTAEQVTARAAAIVDGQAHLRRR